jgi:hypothetical protein
VSPISQAKVDEFVCEVRERCGSQWWVCRAGNDEFARRKDEDHHSEVGWPVDEAGKLLGFVLGPGETEADTLRVSGLWRTL